MTEKADERKIKRDGIYTKAEYGRGIAGKITSVEHRGEKEKSVEEERESSTLRGE